MKIRSAISLGAALMMAAALMCGGCAAVLQGTGPDANPAVADPLPAAQASAVPQASGAGEADGAARMAFAGALEALLSEHVLPDGTDCGFDPAADPAGNQFAVTDVDGDGREELILVYVTAPMAGQVLGVYGYDPGTGRLTTQLTEYPLAAFYTNGVVRADWSHNQGLAGEFWPYTLYQYDPQSDAYLCVGMADAWDGSFASVDYEGNPYPKDVDVSQSGRVYYLIPGGEYQQVPPVDEGAYLQWRDSYLGGAEEMEIAFTQLTMDNLQSIQ